MGQQRFDRGMMQNMAIRDAAVMLAISMLPWWKALWPWGYWVKRKHARWAQMAVMVWLTGQCSHGKGDERFLNKLHLGDWASFPWAYRIHEKMVEEDLIGSMRPDA